MASIEQAILYIKDHRRWESATILVKTAGVQQVDEEELIGWAFDYEGDFDLDFNRNGEKTAQNTDTVNFNGETHLYFHPLPSGCFALGYLSQFHDPDGDTISQFSHCLIVTPKLLRAHHNNILVIYQALVARKSFHFLTPDRPVDTALLSLSPIKLGIRHTPIITTDLLEAIHDDPGAEVLAQLLSSCVTSVCTFFTGLSPSIALINGVIQCLPIPLRPELSFSTSLHFSAQRPLRLIAAHERSRRIGDISRRFAIPFFHTDHFDVKMLRERLLANRDWASLVYWVFDRRAYNEFALCLKDKLKYCTFETQHETPDWNLLNRVSRSLFEEWFGNKNSVPDDSLADDLIPSTGEFDHDRNDPSRLLRGDSSHKPRHPDNETNRSSVIKEADLDAISEKLLRLPAVTNKTDNSRQVPQKRLAKQFPQYERDIRQLDSLLARSLFGDNMAHEALAEAWRELRMRLSFHEIDVIRETYIHLVQSIIVQPRDPDYPKPPQRTIDSLEVMSVFLQE